MKQTTFLPKLPVPALFALLISISARSQQPVITGFSPSSAAAGSTITITGTNFNPSAAANIVYFGGVKAAVTAASVTSLTVTVPDGATPFPISVTTNHLTGYSAIPFYTAFAGGSSSLAAGSFSSLPNLTTGLHPYGIWIADLDGDGKPDLITPNNANSPSPSSISVLRNTTTGGTLAFAPEMEIPAPAGSLPYSMVVMDFDGDGRLDIAITSVLSNVMSVYLNTSSPGAISFATRKDFPADPNEYSIAAGDLDGDGKPDLVVSNFLSNTISLYLNTSTPGSVSFAPSVDLPASLAPHNIVVCDLDGDGKPEIAVANTFSSSISLFKNNSTPGKLSFAPKTDIAAGQDEPFGLLAADIDGDGKPDLIMTNDNFNSTTAASVAVSVFRNLSAINSLSFSPARNIGSGNAFNPLVADINGDGRPDMIIPTSANGVNVYLNLSSTGNISLGPPGNFPDLSPYAVASADLNGDNLPDMAVANFTENTISVFKNTVTAASISRFYPTVAGIGQPDTIIGVNLAGASAVTFGGQPAASFAVLSDTCIVAVVGLGSSGSVSVSTLKGNPTLAGFYYAMAPGVYSFSPNTADAGATITINGGNFLGTTAVLFGGIPASSFAVVSPNQITAIVDSGGTGSVTVINPAGTAQLGGFTYLGPTITSFSPTSGAAGTIITINGTWLYPMSWVTIGGVPAASFTNISESTLTAVVGLGSSGAISIGSANGASTKGGFVYTGPSVISVDPDFGGPGTTVLLKGANLMGTTSVSFGGTAATSFTVIDSATVQAVIGTGTTGGISLTTGQGTATYPAFNFVTYPVVGSFSPDSGGPGTTVTINGANFNSDPQSDAVYFGAVKAAVSAATTSNLTVQVPQGANFQPPAVLTNGLVAAASQPFDVTFPGAGPTISSNSFSGPFLFQASASPKGIAVCDFDGDGKPDIVAGCETTVSILRNTSANGLISFAPAQYIGGNLQPQNVAIGDLDGDGKQDLVTIDQGSGQTVAYLNTSTPGAISFGPKISIPNSVYGTVAIADMDGDGKADLVLSTGSQVLVFRNTSTVGAISFAQPFYYGGFGQGTEVGVADVDGDGKPDIVLLIAGYVTNSGYIAIARNTSTPGSLNINEVAFISVGDIPIGVTVADVDQDGRPDIIMAFADDDVIRIMPNTSAFGAISFGPLLTFPFPANFSPWQVSLNDMDGDGIPDLIVTDLNYNGVSVLKNASTPGNFSFPSRADLPLNLNVWQNQASDLDGDGRPEIIVSETDGTRDSAERTIAIFHNLTGRLSNTPSVMINGSAAICQGDSVQLLSNSAVGVNSQWYKDGQAIPGETAATLMVTDSGIYTVVNVYPGATSLMSAGDTVTLIATPPQPTVSVDSMMDLTSSANSGNQWYIDTTTAIPGATARTYKPTSPGYYAVQVTQNGCPSLFSDTTYYVISSSANRHAIVAPNPVITGTTQIFFNFPGGGSLNAGLYDVQGRELRQWYGLQSGANLDLSNLLKGEYLLKLTDSAGKSYATIPVLKL